MKDAKRHQRSLIVTLIDLQNAFGEVHHNLIKRALRFHYVPDHIVNIVSDIYTDTSVQVAHSSTTTPLIYVKRGVLQGDPCSPLLFNMCFNTLMITVSKNKYKQYGYLWGPNNSLHSCSFLQFADDTALVSNSLDGAQALLNITIAWCKWADMTMRINKCSTFGMMKRGGQYCQFQPGLFVADGGPIPPVKSGDAFVYLGRSFDFNINHESVKSHLSKRLRALLLETSKLQVRPQSKLKILKMYIPSQISFILKSYDIPLTWISNNLDSLICTNVRNWLELPISTCISEILELPKNKGGFGIPSLKSTAEMLRLGQRHRLKASVNSGMNELWSETSSNCVNIDTIINGNSANCKHACKTLRSEHETNAGNHVQTLKLQGALITAITDSVSKTAINKWSSQCLTLAAPLFKFVRKALLQQLPTASNLHRWGKSLNPTCLLCNKKQSNKHVLSNCSSPVALKRYRSRHDNVLSILAAWIATMLKPVQVLHVDLNSGNYESVNNVFHSLRPDIVIAEKFKIVTLELTVCHESNLQNSKQFKTNKYLSLFDHLTDKYSNCVVTSNTIEITTLGIVSDINSFCRENLKGRLPDTIKREILQSVVSDSFKIYCNRNNNTTSDH